MSGPALSPLDAPVWQALTSHQASLARGSGPARRFDPDHALFAAVVDHSAQSHAALADLVTTGETIGLFEPAPPPSLPGFRTSKASVCVQMVAPRPAPPPAVNARIVTLGDDDAPAMQALAALTRPGPFFARTHRFGGFVGIWIDGHLAAMAGTRLAMPGYRELSGVCTHPDYRGRGLAAALIATVAGRILAAGDTPYLTSYADNVAAVALYERLGFVHRRELALNVYQRL